MASSNSDKQKRGNSLKRVLKYMMELCKELGYISDYETNYKLGMPGYTDQNQFKASYKITFDDNSEWIVYTTTLKTFIRSHYSNVISSSALT